MSTTTTEKVWARAWNLGDALWWKNEQGVHCIVLTEEAEFGPRGAMKRKGTMTTIHGDDLDDVNAALAALDFEPTDLSIDDILWNPAT